MTDTTFPPRHLLEASAPDPFTRTHPTLDDLCEVSFIAYPGMVLPANAVDLLLERVSTGLGLREPSLLERLRRWMRRNT